MFVKADLTVGMPLSAAKEALERALADGGLVAESRRAVADGLVFVMSVGPRGSQVLAREVVVRLLPGHDVDRRFLVPLRWEATGPGGRVFPALDADLELTVGDSADACRLSIMGRYEPPLGWLGDTLDRAVMSRVASATMTALLREVADQLTRWSQ
jgi:hypothetical protein